MAVHSLYRDFIKFLDQLSQNDDPWASYEKLYFQPHALFLRVYFESFHHFDLAQIRRRVSQIKPGDYGLLRSLIQSQDPAALAEEALGRCLKILLLESEPPVYLFVGFFSPDGSTLDVNGLPAIALGLERFKDFKDLPLLVAHEYSHCAERSFPKNPSPEEGRPLISLLTSEGLAVSFTEAVYPEIPLHRHLFLTPERLQWCLENQEMLIELAGPDSTSEKLVPVFFGPGDPDAGIPPRVGYFLARQMLQGCLAHHGAEALGRDVPGFERVFQKIMKAGLDKKPDLPKII
jgi:hypothetical protein